jgi:hypothetical protein
MYGSCISIKRLALAIVLVAGFINADTVLLRNGRSLDGLIYKESADSIYLDGPMVGLVQFARADVERTTKIPQYENDVAGIRELISLWCPYSNERPELQARFGAMSEAQIAIIGRVALSGNRAEATCACKVLGEAIKDTVAAKHLVQVLDHPDVLVVQEAVGQLRWLKYENALPALRRTYYNGNASTKLAVLRTVSTITSDGPVDSLILAAASDTSEFVRKAGLRLIQEYQNRNEDETHVREEAGRHGGKQLQQRFVLIGLKASYEPPKGLYALPQRESRMSLMEEIVFKTPDGLESIRLSVSKNPNGNRQGGLANWIEKLRKSPIESGGERQEYVEILGIPGASTASSRLGLSKKWIQFFRGPYVMDIYWSCKSEDCRDRLAEFEKSLKTLRIKFPLHLRFLPKTNLSADARKLRRKADGKQPNPWVGYAVVIAILIFLTALVSMVFRAKPRVKGDNSPELTFFTTAPAKFAVASIFTLGLYNYYWFYRSWKLYREQTGARIVPWLRGLFAPLFSYQLFKIASSQTDRGHGGSSKRPMVLTAAYLLMSCSWLLMSPWFWLWPFSFIPLVLAQKHMVRHDPESGKVRYASSRLGVGHIMLLVFAGWIVVLLYAALFLFDWAVRSVWLVQEILNI